MSKYLEKPIEKWNTRDLTDYMSDQHREKFGCEYQPFVNWAAERGRISTAFGTAKKPGKYDKAVIVEFIDHCFATYKPTAQYPGISFGFMLTYKTADLQRIERMHAQRTQDDVAVEVEVADVVDWFNG